LYTKVFFYEKMLHMNKISLFTPFFSPLYYKETTASTMSDARLLAAQGEPHGTVVIADVQEAGRGRTRDRPWIAGRGESLLFTILLRYPDFSALPQALTLRTGLALSLAIEDFAPPLKGLISVKWPNDIMIGSPKAGPAPKAEPARKAGGILTEGDGKNVFIGAGINVFQETVPEAYRAKAVSIAMALGELSPGGSPGKAAGPDARFTLMEKILARLYRELDSGERPAPAPVAAGAAAGDSSAAGTDGEARPSWRSRLEERLYLKGQPVRFIPGGAGSGDLVEGVLRGIGPQGELLILPRGAAEVRSFVTGELDVYGPAG
jgi:BirA family biotin operon repressor/biotin-[acetyl-CoA-carboxylase] ligase